MVVAVGCCLVGLGMRSEAIRAYEKAARDGSALAVSRYTTSSVLAVRWLLAGIMSID